MQDLLPQGIERVLVTGGAGFIGGALVRRLLTATTATVFNLDKLGYASDLTSIGENRRHQLLQVDLTNAAATAAAVRQADPDLVFHLAAESHVDRSISGPGAFIESNVTGTFHLLQAVRAHWEALPQERQERFRFHHISSAEVLGSLGPRAGFQKPRPTTRAAPIRPARPPVITWCGLGTTPTGCPWCSPTALTTTGPGSSPRS